MGGLNLAYVEEQILEALDHVFSKAVELRSGSTSGEGVEDLLSATLSAILLVRAYGVYGYIDEEAYLDLEKVVKSVLRAYLAPEGLSAEAALEELLSVMSSVAECDPATRRARVTPSLQESG